MLPIESPLGAYRASTMSPFTWINQAMGLSAIRLGSVHLVSIGPNFNKSMIAVDFAEPVFGLTPNWLFVPNPPKRSI